jgi:hypothetical protein
VFKDGKLDWDKLEQLIAVVGKVGLGLRARGLGFRV